MGENKTVSPIIMFGVFQYKWNWIERCLQTEHWNRSWCMSMCPAIHCLLLLLLDLSLLYDKRNQLQMFGELWQHSTWISNSSVRFPFMSEPYIFQNRLIYLYIVRRWANIKCWYDHFVSRKAFKLWFCLFILIKYELFIWHV